MILTILLVLFVFWLIGGVPVGYYSGWTYGHPYNLPGLILMIFLILLLFRVL
jgi:hypothetical protein